MPRTPTNRVSPNDAASVIADRLRAASRHLAERWLVQLRELLPVDANEVFPSDLLLDHVPALIREIADHVGHQSDGALAGNTSILSKAQELGDLRFAQRASVHQLLREYRLLADVLGRFVRDQIDAIGTCPASECIVIMMRLSEAVMVLLQRTVDTFVDRYTQQIEQQTVRLDGFNQMVSHELRQPLSSVQHALDLLRTAVADDPAERQRVLDVANRNVRRLADLIRTLGLIAGPNHDTPQLQVIDPRKLVADVAEQLREAADQKGVRIASRIAVAEINVDVARFELLLVNLVSNGIKYRDPDKPEATVEIGLTPGRDNWTLTVSDNGLGIREEDQKTVFKRFYRGHADRDEELGNSGVGLGLAIAAECARGLGGTIRFESAVGRGTTFIATWPKRSTTS